MQTSNTSLSSYFVWHTILAGVLIGLLTGLNAVIFRGLIIFFHHLFFTKLFYLLAFYFKSYALIFLPASGGLVVGIAKAYLKADFVKIEISTLLAQLAHKRYTLPLQLVWWQLLAAAITMGSGGSVGPEGPVILMGCTIGNFLAQKVPLFKDMQRELLAAGAAGGIAASFHAPLTGLVFAQEVILGHFCRNNMLILAVSSVVASGIAVLFQVFISSPAFLLPIGVYFSPADSVFIILLSSVAGIYGAVFIKFVYYCQYCWQKMRAAELIKPVLGGMLVGIMGLWLPEILGEGHEGMQLALLGKYSLKLCLQLVLIKALSTSISLGSGGVGGIFAPTLFLGTMLGSLGGAAISIFQATPLNQGFAVLGMAAVFAAVFKAPFTAILITFELTKNYNLILPIITASVIATLISSTIEQDSIYTARLTKQGMQIAQYQTYLQS